MSKKKISKLLIVLCAVFTVCIAGNKVKAATETVNIVPDKANAKVSVTISDKNLEGQNVSVVCYAPGYNGDVTNLSANEKYVEYIGQTKVSGTAFTFPLKGSVQSGQYTLVIGTKNGKITKTFSFVAEVAPIEINVMNVKAVQTGATKVKVSWTKMKGVSQYTIYRSTKKSGPFTKIGTSKTAEYTDKKVKAGKTYYYEVVKDVSQNGRNAVKVTLMKAPSIKVKAAKKSIVVSWKKDASASGYKVYVSNKKKGKYTVKATLNKNKKVKTTIKKLKKGKKYFVKVCAYKNLGKKKVLGKASLIKAVKVK